MRNLKCALFAGLLCFSAFRAHAVVLPCSAGPFNSINGTACLIGDITFQFADVSGVNNVPLGDVILTPEANNPSSLGFTLSAAPAAVPPYSFSMQCPSDGAKVCNASPAGDLGGFLFNVQFRALTSESVIVGSTVTLSGVTTAAPDGDSSAQVSADELIFGGAGCDLSFSAGVTANHAQVISDPSETRQLPPACPVSGENFSNDLQYEVFNGAISLETASYYVNETPSAAPTDEPAGFSLLGTALLALAGAAKTRRAG